MANVTAFLQHIGTTYVKQFKIRFSTTLFINNTSDKRRNWFLTSLQKRAFLLVLAKIIKMLISILVKEFYLETRKNNFTFTSLHFIHNSFN